MTKAAAEFNLSKRQIRRLVEQGTVKAVRMRYETFVYVPDLEKRPRRGEKLMS